MLISEGKDLNVLVKNIMVNSKRTLKNNYRNPSNNKTGGRKWRLKKISRSVILSPGCSLEYLGKIFKILTPKPHARANKSKSQVGARRQNSLKLCTT